jgi:hypothetical protein
MTKLIAATTLILMLTSAADAESWMKVERPCGSKCPQETQSAAPPAVGSVRFRDNSPPDYESRSRTVIQTRYGTSVINSTYRSYSR